MRAKKCCPPAGARPPIAPPRPVPPWQMDGLYTIATSEVIVTIVTVGALGSGPQVRADVNRWGIGFININPGAGPVRVSPDRRADTLGEELPAGLRMVWYDLATFGPMVTSEWYVHTTPGPNCAVYEIRVMGGAAHERR